MPDNSSPLISVGSGAATGAAVGGPVGAIIGGVIGLLGGLFGGGSGDLKKIAERQTADEQVFRGNAAFSDAFHKLIWTQGLKRFLPILFDWLHELIRNPLEAIRQLLTAIDKIKRTIDRLFVDYISPILNLIQRVRRILLLLKLLHVKFADSLDKRLSAIERGITAPFLLLHRKVNEIVNVLNLVLDPFGFIHKNVIWGSVLGIYTELGAIIRGVGDTVGVVVSGKQTIGERKHALAVKTEAMSERFRTGNLNAREMELDSRINEYLS